MTAEWRPSPPITWKSKTYEECLDEIDEIYPDMDYVDRVCQATMLYHLYHRTLQEEAGVRDICGPLS